MLKSKYSLILPDYSLRIQTGRYEGMNVEDRICLYCDLNVIDDECHLVTTCTFHNTERFIFQNEIGNRMLIPTENVQQFFVSVLQKMILTYYTASGNL